MPHVDLNGVRYHAEIAGSGAPILFLHGFTGCAENWAVVTGALSAKYSTIAVDLLGHGQTDSPPDPSRYKMEHAAADLIGLIQELGYEAVHLVGYSMGGRLALFLALHYPLRISTLLLESASPGLADPVERRARQLRDEALAGRIEENGIQAFVNEWENLPLFATQSRLPADVRARLHQQRLRNHPLGLANSLRGMGTGTQPSLWENLGEVKMPLTLMAGALDEKFTALARQMSERIPHTKLSIIPAAGHTIHLEQVDAFIDRLFRHLP